MIATEYNCGTICLMLKYILVSAEFFAATFPIATLEFYLGEQIACDTVHLIKLRIASAKRTVIGVLCKPMTFAV